MRKVFILAAAFAVIFSAVILCVYAETTAATYLVSDKDGLFLYAEADGGAETIAFVGEGTYLTVTETSGYFGKTTYLGVEGWFLLTQAQKIENTDPGLQAISVSALPLKTDYFLEDPLDLTGLEITAYYQDGKTEIITGYTIFAHRLTEYGTNVITVYYGGVSTSFSVNVKYLPVQTVTITSPPEKRSYYTGDSLETSGLEILVAFSDGRPPVSTTTDFSVEGFDSSVAGTQTLRVYYPSGGKSVWAEFTVTVSEKTLLNLEITKLPDKLNYFTDDLSLDLDGLILTAQYDNGESVAVTPDQTVFQPLSPGTNDVTLGYSGKTVSFSVTVSEAVPTGLSIAGDFRTEFGVGDTVNLSGMIVYAVYNSGNKKQVSDYMVSDLTHLQIGDNPVTVTWSGFQTMFTVKISVKELVGDVDLDGKVTAGDARLVLRFAARLSAFTEVQAFLADVNLDGAANADDARLLLRFAAGLITTF